MITQECSLCLSKQVDAAHSISFESIIGNFDEITLALKSKTASGPTHENIVKVEVPCTLCQLRHHPIHSLSYDVIVEAYMQTTSLLQLKVKAEQQVDNVDYIDHEEIVMEDCVIDLIGEDDIKQEYVPEQFQDKVCIQTKPSQGSKPSQQKDSNHDTSQEEQSNFETPQEKEPNNNRSFVDISDVKHEPARDVTFQEEQFLKEIPNREESNQYIKNVENPNTEELNESGSNNENLNIEVSNQDESNTERPSILESNHERKPTNEPLETPDQADEEVELEETAREKKIEQRNRRFNAELRWKEWKRENPHLIRGRKIYNNQTLPNSNDFEDADYIINNVAPPSPSSDDEGDESTTSSYQPNPQHIRAVVIKLEAQEIPAMMRSAQPSANKESSTAEEMNPPQRTPSPPPPSPPRVVPDIVEVKKSVKPPSKSNKPSNPYPCQLCDKTYTTIAGLKRHARTHTGVKPFKCDMCKKTFSQSGNLRVHIKTMHSTKKPFKCTKCDKSFSQRGNLVRHELAHQETKPFPCTQCDKSFVDAFSLRRHTATHSDERPFGCTICGKAFHRAETLKSHKATHRMK